MGAKNETVLRDETAWRKAIADQVRRSCTPSAEAYAAGGDPLIYAVADWIESPPEWVPPIDALGPVEVPIENRFGDAVLDGRAVHRISQKTLAEALNKLGLSLDASAISRIEKGTRAIRLNEAAIIAAVLGFSLAEVEIAPAPIPTDK